MAELGEDMTEYMDSILDNITKQSSYQKKYFTLRRKCEQVQQANEKLVNRLYYAKMLMKLYKQERRDLMERLDELGDDFKNYQVPHVWEDTPQPETSKTVVGQRKIKSEFAPSPPKKPVHAFIVYSERNMPKVQERFRHEHGREIDQRELSRILAEEWNALSMEDKKVYHDIYEKEKERYERRLKEYKAHVAST